VNEKDKKRVNSLPKLPGSMTYRPIPSDYDTFEKLLSQKNNQTVNSLFIQSTSNFSKRKRFVDEKEASPGPKYSLIA
jgi:hypothetical protein